jgi:hypothetical protein
MHVDNIRHSIGAVNRAYLAIAVPHNWGRKPRTILLLGKHWKGKYIAL